MHELIFVFNSFTSDSDKFCWLIGLENLLRDHSSVARNFAKEIKNRNRERNREQHVASGPASQNESGIIAQFFLNIGGLCNPPKSIEQKYWSKVSQNQ